jgi:AcrR family transcriptional regulator
MPRGSLSEKGRKRPEQSKKKLKRVRADAADREKEILEVAVNVFHAKSYSATSVDDVAHDVGILKGSLYYYIDSKEDLLLRIVEDVHEEVEALTQTVIDGEGTPLERLSTYIRTLVEFNARNIKRVRVYYHDYDQLGTDRLASVRKRRRANEQTIVDVINEAKKAKELPESLDERLAARTMFATIIWMYTWFKPGGIVSGSALGDFVASFVLDGLRGTSPAKPKRRSRAS